MRIVAGKYRGKKLWAPTGKDVRPTSERAREALFSILYSKIGGNYSAMNIADIYAGTGAFGFEALSRGFKSVTFVDIDTTAVRKNAKLFPA
ncbi:MAG: RsmD family RNA methyltransferase [Alphaproteobacteria bacterium]|nr:RsmD family RNA methyltransferase [Alphaproteobacteria bacterium]